MDTLQIPIDQRTGKPLVSSAIKASCIGEFTFDREASCMACFEEADKTCEICAGEIDYVETITVPWDTCKKIYKAMAIEAAKILRGKDTYE
jgi:hypothetical protein